MLLALAWRHGRPRRRDFGRFFRRRPDRRRDPGRSGCTVRRRRKAAGLDPARARPDRRPRPGLPMPASSSGAAAPTLSILNGRPIPASGGAWLVRSQRLAPLFCSGIIKKSAWSLAPCLFLRWRSARPSAGPLRLHAFHFSVADRFIYLASIGPLALLAAGGPWSPKRPSVARPRAGRRGACASRCCGLTCARRRFYRTLKRSFPSYSKFTRSLAGGATTTHGPENKGGAAAFGEALAAQSPFRPRAITQPSLPWATRQSAQADFTSFS